MSAPLRRRLELASVPLEAEWIAAWDGWCLRLVRFWRGYDPGGRAHHTLALDAEKEWVNVASAEEEEAFLTRGERIAEKYGLPPGVWTWFWRDAYGPRLRGDLKVWPGNLRPTPALGQDTDSCIDDLNRTNSVYTAALVMAVISILAIDK